MRRRPSTSAARPPSSRKPPKTSAYALITHCRSSCENPRSTLIEGSATFTTAMSRTTLNWTVLRSASASHLRLFEATISASFHCFWRRGLHLSSSYLLNASVCCTRASKARYTAPMRKRYDQYCPIARALDLVGDRWALLVIRELMHGPKRYTDLVDHLPGIGTNILASRLRDLEAGGVVAKRTLPPPAASRVYDLTEYGRGLRATLRELALWGARSLGPPTAEDELFPGWLENAVDIILAPLASPVDGEARAGGIEDPDVVVKGDADGVYHMFVDRRLDLVSVEGDRDLLEQLVDLAP